MDDTTVDLTTLDDMSRSTIRDNNNADDTIDASNGSASEEAIVSPPPPFIASPGQQYSRLQQPPNAPTRRPYPMNRTFIRGGSRDNDGAHPRRHHVHFHNHVQFGGHGVVSVPLNRQVTHPNDGITTSIGGSRGVNVRVVPFDPLVPQPAPDSTTQTSRSTAFASRRFKQNVEKENSPSLERFKCDICYEYLKDPVSCGKCSSRFCLACLDRVFQSDVKRLNMIHAHNRHSQSNTDDGNSTKIHPKCPTCRQEYERIVPDHALNNELRNGPTLPCRYDGCPEDALKLTLIAEHERICDHAPVRCRYAGYGCRWTGKRCMVHSHEQYGCKVAPLGPVIDQLRSIKADHGTRLGMMGQQVGESSRMNNFVRQNMAKNQMISVSDTFSVLHYCVMVTCAGPLFLFTKEKWALYWRPNESRAALINVLIFAPFLLASFGTFVSGTNSFLNLLDILAFAGKSSESGSATGVGSATGGAPTIWTASSQRLMEDAFLGFCAGLLGILVIAFNFVDTKSSLSWRGMSIPHLGNPPVICDLIAVSTFTLLLTVMEYHNAGLKAFALWMMIATCSTFFPSLILSLSTYALQGMTDRDAPKTAARMSDMARSVEPLMFGLRFGLLATYFDMLPCLDAVILVGVLRRGILGRLSDKVVQKDCFLENIPGTVGLAFLGLKLGIWGFQHRSLFSCQDILTILLYSVGWKDEGVNDNGRQLWATIDTQTMTQLREFQGMISESIFATNALLLMNCFIYCSFYFGIKVGNLIASTSQADVIPVTGVRKDYNFLGIVAFAGWAITMTLILQL